MIGSVKTNSGHAEACANFVSLAKVLIAFETGVIPATIQYKTPNPNIKGLIDGRLKVVDKNTEWDGDYAAIHGIGLSSSYAHCVLKRNVKKKVPIVDDIPRLVLASTRTEEGIKEVFDDVSKHKVLGFRIFTFIASSDQEATLRSRVHCPSSKLLLQNHPWSFIQRLFHHG